MGNKANVLFPIGAALKNSWVEFLAFWRWPLFKQFINFGLVGFSNLLVAYSAYAILLLFGIHPQIANLFSFAVSVANAYLLNRFWVFRKSETSRTSTPLKFIAVYGGNLGLGIVLLYLYTDVWHLNPYLAPFLSLPLTVPVNYLLNKYWVFRGSAK
jgi:putative flippase GtrA